MDNNYNDPNMQNGNPGMDPNMQNGGWNNGMNPNMQNGNPGMDPNMQNGGWNNGMNPNMQNGNPGMDPNMQNGGQPQAAPKKKSKAAVIFSSIVVALFVGVILYLGGIAPMLKASDAKNLTGGTWSSISSGDYVSVDTMYGSKELFEITSTINGIPIGKEHYYVIFSDDFTQCAVVRADSDWYKENFNGEGVSSKILKFEGMVKEVNSKGREYMREQMSELESYGFSPASETLYIDLLAKQYSIYTFLCCGIGILLWVVSVFFVGRMQPNSGAKKALSGVIGILIFAVCVFAIHVLQFIL